VLRNRAQAEEVAQEVFLEVWQVASRYDPGKGTATAWVREAVVLACYGGYTHHQVASVLGVPLGTAKTRIRDGLARLRDAMLDGAAATSGLGHAVISGLGAGAEAAQASAGIAVVVAVP
jgi:DNA-directed RNA polymerase specialized sigma24 family protein